MLCLARTTSLTPRNQNDPNAHIVHLQGRVACCVNTADSLIFTKMVFNNILAPLSPAEAAALLSAFVFQQNSAREEYAEGELPLALQGGLHNPTLKR